MVTSLSLYLFSLNALKQDENPLPWIDGSWLTLIG